MKDAVAWRQTHHREGSDNQVKKSNSSKSLQTGDVFITRHSNLAQVHVVFHMVVNDTLRSGREIIFKTIKDVYALFENGIFHDIEQLQKNINTKFTF